MPAMAVWVAAIAAHAAILRMSLFCSTVTCASRDCRIELSRSSYAADPLHRAQQLAVDVKEVAADVLAAAVPVLDQRRHRPLQRQHRPFELHQLAFELVDVRDPAAAIAARTHAPPPRPGPVSTDGDLQVGVDHPVADRVRDRPRPLGQQRRVAAPESARTVPSAPAAPCRTVMTNRSPTKTSISPVSTTSEVSVSSECST